MIGNKLTGEIDSIRTSTRVFSLKMMTIHCHINRDGKIEQRWPRSFGVPGKNSNRSSRKIIKEIK